MERPMLYFPRDVEWYEWLLSNHNKFPKGVYLIFYKLENAQPSMRWEEAVKVALCFGWIDSTVKSLGSGKRQQLFTPRNPKSTWSALNKSYIKELETSNLIHESGFKMIILAKEKGTWSTMDDVENLVIPASLQKAFDTNSDAFAFYTSLTPGYQKSYLRWIASAKREETKLKRITEIIRLCKQHIKSR